MDNSAEGFDSSLPQAFSRMMETQDVLNSLRDMQVSRLKIVEDIMPRIWKNFGPPIPTIEVANIMVSVFHKYRRCRCLNLRQGAADVFLEMVTQPFPGFDGIVPDSSNRATV